MLRGVPREVCWPRAHEHPPRRGASLSPPRRRVRASAASLARVLSDAVSLASAVAAIWAPRLITTASFRRARSSETARSSAAARVLASDSRLATCCST